MSKKHAFLQFFSKITIFACVFCAIPAWSDTACDTNFTPIMGNSVQNGTPTPTTPVEVVSVGNKTKNLFDSSYILKGTGWTINDEVYTGEISRLYSKFITAGYPFDRPFKANTSYTIKYHCEVLSGTKVNPRIAVHYTDGTVENVIPIPREVGEKADALLTTPNNKTILKVTFGYGSNGQVLFDNIIITESSAAPTEYIPYGYRIPGTSIYLDEPLRKVGNYADELRPDGTVIRRVGVKVLDGTEEWTKYANAYPFVPNLLPTNYATGTLLVSNYYSGNTANSGSADYGNYSCWVQSTSQYPRLYIRDDRFTTLSGTTGINDFKAYLVQQYAAGTPVTVYYPLATEVVESWSCGPIADIKIATTKYVDDEFAPLDTALANAISVVDNVVTQTIAQAGQIATLQNTKQTRPDDDNECPAGKKCLLVTDETGTPHWYEIIEP